jgi:phosphoribosylglycinamide formyltransferase-1
MSGLYILPRLATLDNPLKLAVLISGSGSGLEALLVHQETHDCAHETVVVISDQAAVKGLDRAANHGVVGVCVPLPPRQEFAPGSEGLSERRRAHEKFVQKVLDEYDVDLVVCSGYMRIFTAQFLIPHLGRIVNIHPSPWGQDGALFPGPHSTRDLLAAGAKTAGASVHFVSPGVDDGPLIASQTTAVIDGENEATLGERIRSQIEHQLYPTVIDALATGRVEPKGANFIIRD